MRTTLSIDDDLWKRMKEKAEREGMTMREVANDLLRQALVQQRPVNKPKLMLRGWDAVEKPGVDLLNRVELFDLIER